MRVILTSDEANEAFERAFLQARHEVWAALTHFNPDLPLISASGRRIGATWADMIADTLARGVRVSIALSEADPYMRPALHRTVHAAARRLRAQAEEKGVADLLEISVRSHPARENFWTRRAAWQIRKAAVRRELQRLGALDDTRRAQELADMPGLAPYVTGADGGTALRRLAHPPIDAARHHHQLLVADRHMLVLGGPDSDPLAGRYGLRLVRDGQSAADAQAHLEHFSDMAAGRHDVGTHRHLLRTLCSPGGLFRRNPTRNLKHDISSAHIALARRAENLIYIETRAFTDPELAQALALAGASRRDLGLIVLLPKEAPSDPDAQRQVLALLAKAYGPRFFAGQMLLPLCVGGQRLALFDKRAALVTSADLTPAALHRDTEAGLYVRTPREVNEIGSRAMGFWLALTRTPAPMDGPATVNLWRARAQQQGARMRPYLMAG